MSWGIREGDALARLREMPDESVHCVVTSPPYWGLRDYGVEGQLGLERTPEEYTAALVGVFAEVRRVLRDDGTLWLNLGDSFASDTKCGGSSGAMNADQGGGARRGRRLSSGLKPKDLVGIPWRVAFALQADGWYLRSDCIWSKPNPMPESVGDRPTRSHEYLFLLAKSERYHYDGDAIREPYSEASIGRYAYSMQATAPTCNQSGDVSRRERERRDDPAPNPLGRNRRSVWTVTTESYTEAHFATYPPALVEPCIKAGCQEGGTVLDPFAGAGTTGLVATCRMTSLPTTANLGLLGGEK